MRPGFSSRRARHRPGGQAGRAPVTPADAGGSAADVAWRRRWRRTSVWAAALIAAGAAAVAIELASTSRGPAPNGTTAVDRQSTSAAPAPALGARQAGRIPLAIQDAAAAPLADDEVAVLGGLDAAHVSRARIVMLRRGTSSDIGALPTPLHDAAAVTLGNSVYLFGGGQSTSNASIVAVDPHSGRTSNAGQLPEPRSDLAAAGLDGTAYLIGGYTGQRPLDTILAWRPGQPARVVARLPEPLRYAAAAAAGSRIVIAGGQTPQGPTRQILSFNPATGHVASLGSLPKPISHAAAAPLEGSVYVVGGRDERSSPTRSVTAVDPASGAVKPAGSLPGPLSDATATAVGSTIVVAGGQSGAGPVNRVLELSDDPGNPKTPTARIPTPSTLRPGSDPSALPGDVLIADKANNRLLVVTPQGQIVWSFPRPGDLRTGQTFLVPDDAFFTYDGRQILATEEDDFVISLIDMGSGQIVYRYGHPGIPGSTPGYVYNPDDAISLRDGRIVSADIKNCRLIELQPPLQHPLAQIATTGACFHGPPAALSSPNGAFPLSDGGTVVTEIGGQWIDVFNRSGEVTAATNPPGFSYPSDTNEVRPGVYLTVDYAQPGTIMELTATGKVLWRFSPSGPDELNHPSLALPLPNGDVLANDDYNDRVIVVDPRNNRIVWQYGHTGVAGTSPGYLNIPDGVDLAPPYSLSERFPQVRGLPGH